MDARLLLRQAVKARIATWDHPFIDERDEAAGEVRSERQFEQSLGHVAWAHRVTLQLA